MESAFPFQVSEGRARQGLPLQNVQRAALRRQRMVAAPDLVGRAANGRPDFMTSVDVEVTAGLDMAQARRVGWPDAAREVAVPPVYLQQVHLNGRIAVEMPMNVAKLFSHGGSQAVRLPKEFRFEGTEVHVRRVGNDVVLSALPAADLQSMLDSLDAFEPAVHLEREQPAAQERTAIEPRR